jgi:hypothetical protein
VLIMGRRVTDYSEFTPLTIRDLQLIKKREQAQERLLINREGATKVITTPRDECLIVGHRWLPERMMTRWCRVCNVWEAL